MGNSISGFFNKLFGNNAELSHDDMTGIPDGMEEDYKHGVAPSKADKPVMYTLHTCRHCDHLKDFLNSHGISHYLVFVDDFDNPARTHIMQTLRSYNPRTSFPTLVLPDERVLVGFRKDAVIELFNL